MRDAARGTQVTVTIDGVTQATGKTGRAAARVLEASQRLDGESNTLNQIVQSFLADVQPA